MTKKKKDANPDTVVDLKDYALVIAIGKERIVEDGAFAGSRMGGQLEIYAGGMRLGAVQQLSFSHGANTSTPLPDIKIHLPRPEDLNNCSKELRDRVERQRVLLQKLLPWADLGGNPHEMTVLDPGAIQPKSG